jgi:hypothetical protein
MKYNNISAKDPHKQKLQKEVLYPCLLISMDIIFYGSVIMTVWIKTYAKNFGSCYEQNCIANHPNNEFDNFIGLFG